ncbi:hypothetical protein [Hyalangium sp.]|uniref:hypothetical protein n=1 Tax=Hyalangium sp. TaxID=2028555 RepID=UPI002D4D8237|nr:hypothetical protein [Hyalangium sp.]HYH96176.1 hypothetical protein [Hyalangium sp.]
MPTRTSGQLAFGFLGDLPRVDRRAQRAFRPHLRGRTQPEGQQLVLPLRSAPGARRYAGVEAIALEDALRAARAGSPGAVEHLLELTRSEVAEVARAAWRPGCPLSLEDLQHEGELELLRLKAWERFTPGVARGRTLWPAYVRKLARQAMGRALEATAPIHVTRWGRRQRKAAQARAVAEEKTLEEVLSKGGTSHAGALLLAEESLRAVPLEEAALVCDELEIMQSDRAEEARAVVALAALPVRLRVAVAGPMGLLREGVVGDRALARRLHTTLEGVRQLREEGLRELRAALAEA